MSLRSIRPIILAWTLVLVWAGGVPSDVFAGDTSPEAYFEKGHKAYYGKGVVKDRVKALRYFRKACDGDHVEGCLWSGKLYAKGVTGERDPDRAQAQYEKALVVLERTCRADDLDACFQAADMLRAGVDDRGQGVTVDAKKAEQLETIARVALTKRCEKGKGEEKVKACDALIGIYKGGDNDHKLSGALSKKLGALDTACNGGAWEACTQLSELYAGGKTVAQDMDMAKAYFDSMVNLRLQACKDGSVEDCLGLGNVYLHGEGVAEKMPDRAKKLFKQACKLGSKKGCKALKD